MPMCKCYVCQSDLVSIAPCENDPLPAHVIVAQRERKPILSPRYGEVRA